jgi:hypothetical protein
VVPIANLATGTPDGTKFVRDDGTLAVPSLPVATQAEMEAASSTSVGVTPGRTQYHPGVAKAVVRFDGTGASPITKDFGYNISGTITKSSTGVYVISWTTSFSSSTAYGVTVTCGGATDPLYGSATSYATGSVTIKTVNSEGTVTDPAFVVVTAFGDQ